jgi:phospholipase C
MASGYGRNASVLTHQRQGLNPLGYQWLDQFFVDTERQEKDFPAYVFIEPNYFHIPFEQPQNDDHPPHSTIPAQVLLGKVYNALRSNSDLWNSTLFVVLYDENGGFYDHVSPPAAVPPDDYRGEGFDFKQLGVRVPALLVSPWVGQGVLSTEFDHTSLLKYLTDKWGLGPLTERVQQARSFVEAIRMTGQPRSDTPESVPVPALMRAVKADVAEEPEELNENQKALLAFTDYLEQETALPAVPRVVAAAAGPGAQAKLAKDRVRAFMDEKKATLARPSRFPTKPLSQKTSPTWRFSGCGW